MLDLPRATVAAFYGSSQGLDIHPANFTEFNGLSHRPISHLYHLNMLMSAELLQGMAHLVEIGCE